MFHKVACKDFEPELPDADTNDSLMGDEEASMKVVRLIKGDEPLVRKFEQKHVQ